MKNTVSNILIFLIFRFGSALIPIQSNLLKKNLVKDSKDSKSTPIVLVSSEIIPSQQSTLTITELDSDSEELSDTGLSEFDESLALLTNSFKRSKKVFKPSTSRKSSDNKYLKLKEKYQKLKNFKRKGKGLIAEEHDWAESEESSSDEEKVANLCLMAEIKEEVQEPT
ncbi:hypothetical protein L6452_21677 [Arctium lappa]|uniref:Uncharacterized protein n=1 Tax=Arctium lappa TaxID=4217 RepID=A0ACB9AY16_ARCLA|nr:hypothetical protein L6452_21677 [Arctium lappa]